MSEVSLVEIYILISMWVIVVYYESCSSASSTGFYLYNAWQLLACVVSWLVQKLKPTQSQVSLSFSKNCLFCKS